MTRVAVIGAGMSGLTAARALRGIASVTLFEKSRGVGGRMSTRYAVPYQFDHGAQFFTAKTPEFKRFLAPMLEQGSVAKWDARCVELEQAHIVSRYAWDERSPRFVGVPAMNAVAKSMARGLDVRLRTEVTRLEQDNGWHIFDAAGRSLGRFDWVIATTPPPQAARILPGTFAHHAILARTRMLACFALMLGFKQPLPLSWDAARVYRADIRWIAAAGSKPGRPGAFCLLVHSTHAWAESHLQENGERVKARLCHATSACIGHDVSRADHVAVHAWRYADVLKPEAMPLLIDADGKLAACGDWCIQGRVEAAYTSGLRLASALADIIGT